MHWINNIYEIGFSEEKLYLNFRKRWTKAYFLLSSPKFDVLECAKFTKMDKKRLGFDKSFTEVNSN